MKTKTNIFRSFFSPPRFLVALMVMGISFLSAIESYAQYTVKNASIGGGGFVTGIVTHKTTGERYCRTDVGGAYRWDASNGKWIQLFDWLNESENGFIGVEALALDPQNANNVYMLAGTSYINGGRTAILKSTDKGNTFTYTDVSSQFKAHGNGSGRGNGERLAVDPKNSNILFCGTRANGLWKSTDGGVSWNLAWNGVTSTTNGNGICVVLFDPASSVVNGATQTFYIGVSRTGGATFYKTTNGGASFTDISPTTSFMPHRAALQGTTMYVSYSDNEGPQANGAGKLYKFNTATGVWTNVTPASWKDHPYGGISIDPTNVNRVIVSSCGDYTNNQYGIGGWGDWVFLTTDGGATWTLKNGTNATFDNNGIGWVSAGGINWMDCIEFDQDNLNKVRVVGGGGVFTCPDITAANPLWKYDVIGIEETAWLDGISIPGGPLISSFGDVTGFVHNPITSYPSAKLTPSDGNNQSIAYAGSSTSKVVRASNGGNVVYYSTNMGSSWTGCSSNKGANGKVAINADGSTILHCPGGSSTTYYTTNNGGSWSSCSGVSLGDAIPLGDMVNANYFYIYNPTNGQMLVSSNKGVSFSVASTPGTTTLGHPWVSTYVRAVYGKAGHIWLPLGGNGLRYSTNYGSSFTNVSNVTYCKTVAIGVASGSNYPTVFIWGTVSGVTGLFISADQGASWTRMNDNAHQFAGASFLVGDMNVFGRVYMATGGGRGIVYWEPTACAPTAISPWMQVGGTWTQTSSATVTSGSTVILGPQPVSGGSWSWSGIASGTSREVTLTPTSSGTATATYTNSCGAQSTQTFNITVSGGNDIVNGGIYRIIPRNGGKALDVANCGTANGTNVQNWSWLNNTCQQWQFTSLSDGYWRITPQNATGKALDVNGVSTADGANVQIWDYLSGNNQQWQVVNLNNGYYQIVARHSGKCLDLQNGSTADGSNFHQWTCSSSNTNQHFTFTRLKSAIADATEINAGKPQEEIHIFPNPSDGNLKITCAKYALLRIYTMSGKLVYSRILNDEITEINSQLKSGVYIVKLEETGKVISSKLFIK
jgi:hypothetical protein